MIIFVFISAALGTILYKTLGRKISYLNYIFICFDFLYMKYNRSFLFIKQVICLWFCTVRLASSYFFILGWSTCSPVMKMQPVCQIIYCVCCILNKLHLYRICVLYSFNMFRTRNNTPLWWLTAKFKRHNTLSNLKIS